MLSRWSFSLLEAMRKTLKMNLRYLAHSTVKRKEKLLKDLIEHFGRESDEYFEEGQNYQDILQALKSSLSAHISTTANSPSTEYRRATLKASGEASPKFSPSASSSKSSVVSEDYLDRLNRFGRQKAALDMRSESQKFSSFIARPSLLMLSKEDELKAIQASKERDDQWRMVDFSRDQERQKAAKGIRDYQMQQIKEKLEMTRKIRDQERLYAQEVDSRLRYVDRAVLDVQEREKETKELYKQALLKQLSEKDQERVLVRSIQSKMKNFMTPEPKSPVSPSSQYSRCFSPSSPSKSNLKFLAQYGNLVMSKNK